MLHYLIYAGSVDGNSGLVDRTAGMLNLDAARVIVDAGLLLPGVHIRPHAYPPNVLLLNEATRAGTSTEILDIRNENSISGKSDK